MPEINAPKLNVFIIAELALFNIAMVVVPSVFILIGKNALTLF